MRLSRLSRLSPLLKNDSRTLFRSLFRSVADRTWSETPSRTSRSPLSSMKSSFLWEAIAGETRDKELDASLLLQRSRGLHVLIAPIATRMRCRGWRFWRQPRSQGQ